MKKAKDIEAFSEAISEALRHSQRKRPISKLFRSKTIKTQVEGFTYFLAATDRDIMFEPLKFHGKSFLSCIVYNSLACVIRHLELSYIYAIFTAFKR